MAGAMPAARPQLDVAPPNPATLSTGGFARTVARVGIGDRGLSVREERAAEQGAVRPTGRPFDLALLGPGSFRTDDGTTRDGAFTRDRRWPKQSPNLLNRCCFGRDVNPEQTLGRS